MRHIAKLQLVLGLLGLSTPSLAAEWSLVEVGDNSVVFLDKSSISGPRSAIRAWRMVVKKVPDTDGEASSKQLSQFDCDRRTHRLISWVAYRKSGSVLASGNVATYAQEDTPIVPDSVGETLIDYVCGDDEMRARIGRDLERSPTEAARVAFALAPFNLQYGVKAGLSAYVRETDPDFFENLLNEVPAASRAAVRGLVR